MDVHRTRPTLLVRLKGKTNESAWAEFVDIYTPLLYRFAERRGIPAAEREDIIQDTFRGVASAIERFHYDPDASSFRNWLFTVARSKISNYFRARARRPQAIGGSTMAVKVQEHIDPREAHHWDQDYRRRLFEWAAQQIKPEFAEKTWQAFWMTAVEERDIPEACDALSLSRGAIYVAKSRVMARLREKITSVAGDWDEPMTMNGPVSP